MPRGYTSNKFYDGYEENILKIVMNLIQSKQSSNTPKPVQSPLGWHQTFENSLCFTHLFLYDTLSRLDAHGCHIYIYNYLHGKADTIVIYIH